MSIHSAKTTDENLLSAVVSLPKNKFERLIANALKFRRSLPENKEIRLIKKVNESVLSDAERIRFDELVEKRQSENMGGDELGELIAMSDKSEELNVRRIKCLIEIARIRNKNLREVLKELGIFPAQTV